MRLKIPFILLSSHSIRESSAYEITGINRMKEIINVLMNLIKLLY